MQSITYADMNNNVYRIQPDSIHYDPMQAEFSSSGTYSGGEKQTSTITPEQFQTLCQLVTAIIDNPGLHVQQRRMMTASLRVRGESGFSSYILPRSSAREALETCLKEFLQTQD